MNIVFNTRKRASPASIFYAQAFSKLEGVHYYDWDRYSAYDVALFMSFRKDLKDVIIAREQNPKLKIGLIDSRCSIEDKAINYVDFIIVDSLEMRDFFAQYRRPIFTYYEYPKLTPVEREHQEKETVIIGFHGGKGHLDEEMYPRITKAIEELGRRYSIEFWAMYNVERWGKWKAGVPRDVPVKHIQWSEENYYKYLANVDIGIVPGLRRLKNIQKLKTKLSILKSRSGEVDHDYLIKFKVTSNAGRIIVFSLLGIPVVSDMFPSAMQFIRDGENGFIAYSTDGWYCALEKLIQSCDLRQKFAEKMYREILPIVDYDSQNRNMEAFLETILQTDNSYNNR